MLLLLGSINPAVSGKSNYLYILYDFLITIYANKKNTHMITCCIPLNIAGFIDPNTVTEGVETVITNVELNASRSNEAVKEAQES
jgi:hypothetical protein